MPTTYPQAAVDKMLATTSGLVGVLGPSSDEASAVVPILNSASIPMFPVTGQPSFTSVVAPDIALRSVNVPPLNTS